MDKTEATKYILLKFCDWYYELNPSKKENGENDLSILKSLKLIFFLCSIEKDEKTLLDNPFENFKAMPLGPVEKDVYDFFLEENSIIDYNKTYESAIKNISLSVENKELINELFEELKNKNYSLINNSARYLVDLTHEWSCWKNNYTKAKENSSRIYPIAPHEILEDQKIYSY